MRSVRCAVLGVLVVSSAAVAGPSRFGRPQAPPIRVVISERMKALVPAVTPVVPGITTVDEATTAAPGAPDPAVLARLERVDASALGEPARSIHLLALATELAAQSRHWRAVGAREANPASATQATNRSKSYLLQGVKAYRQIIDGKGVTAEALYGYGDLLQSGRYLKEARGAYDRLLKEYPTSALVPAAYLAFAEYFFAADQLADAEAYYRKVLQFPKASAYWYATYKLGWVDHKLARYQEALERFFQVAQAVKNDRKADPLARAAKLDFVRAYAEIGKADKAWPAFQRVDPAMAFDMLQRLGQLYLEHGKHDRAIYIHQELMKLRPKDPKACAWQYSVARAVVTLGPGADRVREIENLVRLQRSLETAKVLPAGEAAECRANAEALAGGFARAWHYESQKSHHPEPLAYAARLYKLYLEDPGVQDHAEVAALYAEACWNLAEREGNVRLAGDRWEEAALAFAEIAATDPRSKLAATHAAALAWLNALAIDLATVAGPVDATKPTPPQPEVVLAPREAKLVAAIEAVAAIDPRHADLGWMRFIEGAVYRRASQHAKAAPLLRAAITSHRDAATTERAAILAIDSLVKLQQLDAMLLLADQLAADPRFLADKPELDRTLKYVRTRSMRR